MEPHPQAFLENLLKERGYCNEDIQRIRTLDTAYYHKPTPLQLASYEHHLVSLIKSKNVTEFKKLVTCGISPNACNAFGESIVHMVCRRNDEEMLNILLQAGADLQVSDDYGRTPLHDAFWAGEPATDIVHTILSRDPHMLFLADARGTLPTGYIKRDHYETWNEFWRTHVDQYFPLPSSNELLHAQPNTRPVPDPHHAVPLSRAKLVAANRIQAHALALLSHATTTTTTTSDLKEGEEESLEDDTADISYSYDIEDDESSYEDDDSEEYDDESFYSSDEEDDEVFEEEEEEEDDDLHEDLTNILEAFYKTRQ
jgi:ankyrin repeat protein